MSVKAHDLARILLAGPNLTVEVISGEYEGDFIIAKIEVETPETVLHFPEQDHEAELINFPKEGVPHSAWYFENGKTLPWKYEKEPYGIYEEKNDDPCIILLAENAIGSK
jgi:hypothetical protein